MTPTEIGGLIASIGFPIVAAYFMGAFVKARIETSEKAAQERELATARATQERELALATAALEREKALASIAARREEAAEVRESRLGDRINHLEDSIRTEIVTAVNKATDVMSEAKEVMQVCSGTLAAVTVAMQDMKDEAKRANREQHA